MIFNYDQRCICMCKIVKFESNDEMSNYTVCGWESRAINVHVYFMWLEMYTFISCDTDNKTKSSKFLGGMEGFLKRVFCRTLIELCSRPLLVEC